MGENELRKTLGARADETTIDAARRRMEALHMAWTSVEALAIAFHARASERAARIALIELDELVPE